MLEMAGFWTQEGSKKGETRRASIKEKFSEWRRRSA